MTTIVTNKNGIEFDIDDIATDLNNKADIDLINTNPSSSFASALNTAGIRTIVETYQNGTSWYRVYSDGWCEQGGKHTVTAGYGYYTINLLKPYLNTNYNIQLTAGFADYDRSILYALPTLTSSSFQMYFSGAAGDTHTGDWQTSGYIS